MREDLEYIDRNVFFQMLEDAIDLTVKDEIMGFIAMSTPSENGSALRDEEEVVICYFGSEEPPRETLKTVDAPELGAFRGSSDIPVPDSGSSDGNARSGGGPSTRTRI